MNPTISFSGQWIRSVRRPIVYVWRRGEQVLYVGVGTRGLARPIGTHHRLCDIQDTDELDIYAFDTPADAETAEKEFIARLKPTLNSTSAGGPEHSQFVKLERKCRALSRALDIAVRALMNIEWQKSWSDSRDIASRALREAGFGDRRSRREYRNRAS